MPYSAASPATVPAASVSGPRRASTGRPPGRAAQARWSATRTVPVQSTSSAATSAGVAAATAQPSGPRSARTSPPR